MNWLGYVTAGVSGLVLLIGCVTASRVHQMPRDLPAYDASVRVAAHARVALDADAKVKQGLARRLAAAGCELVPSFPKTGTRAPERIVETVRCRQDTEWSGTDASLVSVLVVRVRRPGRLKGKAGDVVVPSGARSFQAVSRLSLGARQFNNERITAEERAAGFERALDNLMRIRAFGEALGSVR